VEDRDEAAGEFGSDLVGMFAENDEVADEVDGEEHQEEWQKNPALQRR